VFRKIIFSWLQLKLNQEDLAFAAVLRELRKALSAKKEKRVVTMRKAGGPAKATTRREGIKRMASQLGLDSSGEPASRRPLPELASGSSSCATTATEGQGAMSSMETQRPVYAAVAAGRAALP
jgi:hypothetical protein